MARTGVPNGGRMVKRYGVRPPSLTSFLGAPGTGLPPSWDLPPGKGKPGPGAPPPGVFKIPSTWGPSPAGPSKGGGSTGAPPPGGYGTPGPGAPPPGAFKIPSTFHRPGFKSGMVQTTFEQARALMASQGIYPAAMYPAPAWAAGFPTGWTSQLLSPTLPASESSLPFSSGGGYGGGGFSLSSIPSWVWFGLAIFGGIYLMQKEGKGGPGGKPVAPKLKVKAK